MGRLLPWMLPALLYRRPYLQTNHKGECMSKEVKFVPRLNADLELKKLGEIMGLPIYIDMANLPAIDDDRKFITYLEMQKMLADFFNKPFEESQPNEQ